MRAVDTNVLVYAHRRECAEHEQAYDRIKVMAEGQGPWGIPWPCIYEFFSVVTNARIWRNSASTPQQAGSQIEEWTRAPGLRLLGETDDFLVVLGRLVKRPRVRGPRVHDARIAALCIAHGVEALVSRDRDFSLFPELVVENPFS